MKKFSCFVTANYLKILLSFCFIYLFGTIYFYKWFFMRGNTWQSFSRLGFIIVNFCQLFIELSFVLAYRKFNFKKIWIFFDWKIYILGKKKLKSITQIQLEKTGWPIHSACIKRRWPNRRCVSQFRYYLSCPFLRIFQCSIFFFFFFSEVI